MLKKLCVLGFIFFLTACGSRMTGETLTICENVPGLLVVGDTVAYIDGLDESIVTWLERTTLSRADFNAHVLLGEDLTLDEIYRLFDYLNELEAPGSEIVLVDINDERAIIEFVSDYLLMDNDHLSELWDVEDFASEVTLSGAIAGLVENNAVCRTE